VARDRDADGVFDPQRGDERREPDGPGREPGGAPRRASTSAVCWTASAPPKATPPTNAPRAPPSAATAASQPVHSAASVTLTASVRPSGKPTAGPLTAGSTRK
jgi:hypothetical protein